jgi:hypothetical protein
LRHGETTGNHLGLLMYPAAHSMDSCWFAVDRDGHVAYFSTGEAGARPEDAVAVENPDELGSQLAHVLARTEPIHDLRGRIRPRALASSVEHWTSHGIYGDEFLFFLPSADAVRNEIADGLAREVRSHHGAAVILLKAAVERVGKRLHETGLCLGCYDCTFRTRLGPEDAGAPPSELGLFNYGHLTENWISGPYGLDERPLRAVHIDEVPIVLRGELRWVEFPTLCFAQTVHIQPVEHSVCSSWESAYLSADGTRIRENVEGIRAGYVPDEYAEWYAGTVREENTFLRGIEVDPPRGRGK